MNIDQGLINMARDEAKYTENEFPLKARLFRDMADSIERLLTEVERLRAENAALKTQVEFDKGDRAYMVELLDKQADQIKHLLRIKDDTVDFLAKE